jgi:hypothetical protein
MSESGEESPSPAGSLPSGMRRIPDISDDVVGRPFDECQLLEKADVPGCH